MFIQFNKFDFRNNVMLQLVGIMSTFSLWTRYRTICCCNKRSCML